MPATALEEVSRKLQTLYSAVLTAERRFAPSGAGLDLLDRLMNDPAWAWLRPLSALIAEVDHALAQPLELSPAEGAAAAAHVRGLIFGEGDLADPEFLTHYRSLLQLDHALASTHGELRKLLKAVPDESPNESERLHARHQWAMRCKHRPASRS